MSSETVFESQPIPCDESICRAGYDVPPRGSRTVGIVRGNLLAIAPDGFEWILCIDEPVWVPNGYWWDFDSHPNKVQVPTIEPLRNFKMRKRTKL
jgi:hypothetical protein